MTHFQSASRALQRLVDICKHYYPEVERGETISDTEVGFALFTAAVCLYAGYNILHQHKKGNNNSQTQRNSTVTDSCQNSNISQRSEENKMDDDGKVGQAEGHDECSDGELLSFTEKALLTRLNTQDKSLDLSYCGLPRIPYSLISSQLSVISKLDLSLNLLTELNEPLTPLVNLTHLDISGNFISILPIHLNELQNLATLNAAYNFITCIDDLCIPKLQHLDLTGNQLLMLPENLGRMSNLKDYDISYNYVTTKSNVNNSESILEYGDEPYTTSYTEEDTLKTRLPKPEKHTLEVNTDIKDLYTLCLTDEKDISFNKVRHIIAQEYGSGIDQIRLCTGVTGPNINDVRDLISKQCFDLVIFVHVHAETVDEILQIMHSSSEKPNVVIIDNIKGNNQGSDYVVQPLLDKDSNVISEILSFQFTNKMAQTRIYPTTQIPQLEKLLLRGYLKKRALMRKSLSAFFFCLNQAELLQKLPLVLKHLMHDITARKQSEEGSFNALRVETPESPEKKDEGYSTASSRSSPRYPSSDDSSPNSSCDDKAINEIPNSKSTYVREFVLKHEFQKSVHVYEKVMTLEYWSPIEDTEAVFLKLACTLPFVDCHKLLDRIYTADYRVTRIHTHSHGMLRLTIEGNDGEFLWYLESRIQKFLQDHYSFVYAWILCPKCIARGSRNPCRRFPIEMKELGAIDRKTHAYCLATKPRRIIPMSDLILKGPTIDKEQNSLRASRSSMEGRIVIASRQRRQEVARNPQWHEGLKDIINRHSSWLFEKHSNLNIISASPVKSFDGGEDISDKRCIVFFCDRKGQVPPGEDNFPSYLEAIPTDVCEGSFHFSQPNPYDSVGFVINTRHYHNPLVVAGSIGREDDDDYAGTLGGFVQDRDDPTIYGFLTCCHVLFKPKLSKSQVDTKHSAPCTSYHKPDEEKHSGSSLGTTEEGAAANFENDWDLVDMPKTTPTVNIIPDIGDEVMQPANKHFHYNEQEREDERNHDKERLCGTVYKRMFDNQHIGGKDVFIDAAFVRVDNGLRGISEGKIAGLYEDQYKHLRKLIRKTESESELSFKSAETMAFSEGEPTGKQLVLYKSGCTTGLRRGELKSVGAAARRFVEDDIEFQSNNCIEIFDFIDLGDGANINLRSDNRVFAEGGDSGSFVFCLSQEGDVKIIGMQFAKDLIRGTYLAMPIEPVLDSLNVDLYRF